MEITNIQTFNSCWSWC